MADSEPVSLDFIEDPYIPKLDDIATPSLDEITEFDRRCIAVPNDSHYISDNNNISGNGNSQIYAEGEALEWADETELYLRNLTLDQIFYDVDSDYTNTLELQMVETEFISAKLANQAPSMSIAKRFRLKFFAKRTMREVKVTFIDFSKPYLAKISSSDNYKKFLNIGSSAAVQSRGIKMMPPTSFHSLI